MVATAAVAELGWILRYRLLALCGVFAANAALWFAGTAGDPYIQAVAGLGSMSAFMLWGTLDAHVHGREIQHGLWMPFMATLPVSLAYYLVWTRGFRRGLISYAKAVGIALVLFVLAGVLGALVREGRGG